MEAPSPDSGKRPAPADEGSDERQAKKKKSKKPVIYRLRAHANPLSDPQYPYPVSPDKVKKIDIYRIFYITEMLADVSFLLLPLCPSFKHTLIELIR
jgi:hypothetical protein